MPKVRKAVIAAAGFGTRFLPQTKAMPKEMLPIVDKPVIQYVVEELVRVGIEDIIIVTGYSKRSIEDHFDAPNADMVANLVQGGPKKAKLLDDVKSISELANFIYIRQKGPYGNGTPILNSEHIIGDEPFIYTFCDDFIEANPPSFQQMIEAYDKYNAPIMSTIETTDPEDYAKYGYASGQEIEPGVVKVSNIIEKPGHDNAPSNMATVSGYLLTPEIFGYLHNRQTRLEPGREFVSNQALLDMASDGHAVIALKIKGGTFYDAGDKLEYIKTVIDFALKHPDIKDEVYKHIKSKVND